LSGIGFSELVVLLVIGLLILGPERLPRVATQIGRWVGRARRTANQLRYQLEREIALADIEEKPKNKKKKEKNDQNAKPGSAFDESGQSSEHESQSARSKDIDAAADGDDKVDDQPDVQPKDEAK